MSAATATAAPATAAAAIPKASFDWKPIVLLLALMAIGLPAVGSGSMAELAEDEALQGRLLGLSLKAHQ